MTSDALPTTAAAAPRLPRPVAGALLSNAVFGGITDGPVAFDPDGVANPTKVLPAGSRCGDLQSVPEGVWV